MFFLGTFLIHLNFFTTPIYQATATILPLNNTNQSSGVSSLASRFGINVGSSAGTEASMLSGSMFPEIIMSRHLSYELISSKIFTKKYNEKRPLANILNNIDDDSLFFDDGSKISSVNKLSRMIFVEKNKYSPLLKLRVKSFEPNLSYDLANLVLTKFDSLLQDWKLSKIIEKKIFIENRIKTVSLELIKAEESLKIFREKNRSIAASPSLMLEQTRLLRELEVITQVYTTLKSQFEMVQIEKYDKSKIMSILDYPEKLNNKIAPKPSRMFTIYFLLLVLVCSLTIISKEWITQNRDKIAALKSQF